MAAVESTKATPTQPHRIVWLRIHARMAADQETTTVVESRPLATMAAANPTANTAAMINVRLATELFCPFMTLRFSHMYAQLPVGVSIIHTAEHPGIAAETLAGPVPFQAHTT